MDSFEHYWDRSRSRTLRRRSFLAASGVAAGAAALAACGGRGGNAQSKTSSKPATSAGTPRMGGQLKVSVPADPFDWDPTYAGAGLPNPYGFAAAYNSLVGYKFGQGVAYDDLTLTPELAESWEVPDAQTFIFHLRKGTKFANLPPVGGRDITSADVKFSYEYAARAGAYSKLPQSQYDIFFEGMSGIETPDASTAIVHFKQPFVPFLNYTASRWVPIYAHEIYDQDGHFKDRIVGSGPFQLDVNASQKGTRWVWKKNPTYWDTGKPYLDEVDWLVLKDDAAQNGALLAKQVDLMFANVDSARVQTLTKSNPALVKYEFQNPAPMHVYMSLRATPFKDIRIRQAVALAINRDEFLKTLYGGKGGWAMAGAFPDTFTQEEIRSLLKYDPAQAKQLVVQAGYPNGFDLQFNYPGNAYGDEYITQMQLLQSQLKSVGINLQLNSLDKDDESTRKKQHNFQMTDTSKSLQGDVDSYLYAAFYPGNRANYTEVNDPGLTPLLDAQRRETDTAKRRDIVRQASKRINTEQFWAQAIYYPVQYNLWQSRLKGYVPYFGASTIPVFTNAWLEG
jgi:peptide/nickel transport system substrate-binding protein